MFENYVTHLIYIIMLYSHMLYHKIAQFISQSCMRCIAIKNYSLVSQSEKLTADNIAILISRMFRRTTVDLSLSWLALSRRKQCERNMRIDTSALISSCRSRDFRSDWFRTLRFRSTSVFLLCDWALKSTASVGRFARETKEKPWKR